MSNQRRTSHSGTEFSMLTRRTRCCGSAGRPDLRAECSTAFTSRAEPSPRFAAFVSSTLVDTAAWSGISIKNIWKIPISSTVATSSEGIFFTRVFKKYCRYRCLRHTPRASSIAKGESPLSLIKLPSFCHSRSTRYASIRSFRESSSKSKVLRASGFRA